MQARKPFSNIHMDKNTGSNEKRERVRYINEVWEEGREEEREREKLN